MNIKRGDIYYADLSPVVGSEQGGVRPILIVQNDMGNKYSPTIIAAAVTSQINKAKLLAAYIDEKCPDSWEKSLAMTKLEECVMWANASIARNE